MSATTKTCGHVLGRRGILQAYTKQLVSGVIGLTVATAALPMIARADDQDIIDYRQHIMKTMGEQGAAIDQILEHKVTADGFATHLQILAITAATAKKAFEPKVQGGEAKPEIWSHWADFSKRLDDLTVATAALAKSAKDGGITATAPNIKDALTCKGCHETYCAEKKQ